MGHIVSYWVTIYIMCTCLLYFQYKMKTLNPKWCEQFDLYMYDEQSSHLEIMVYDYDVAEKNDLMGR